MASATYLLFERAMREGKQVACLYLNHERELCPILLGHSDGQEKALAFQVGGKSGSHLPPAGEWRCLFLSKAKSVRLRDGPLRAGASHTMPQGCVKEVDLDVNPDSPFNPKRRLEKLRK